MVRDMLLAPFIIDYSREGEGPEFLAVLSYVEEKRKKKGFFSRGEELIEYIGKGHLHVRHYEGEGISLLYDPECRSNLSIRLIPIETFKALENWVPGPSPPYINGGRELILRGMIPPPLVKLVEMGKPKKVPPPSRDCLEVIIDQVRRLDLEKLREEIRRLNEIRSSVESAVSAYLASLRAVEASSDQKGESPYRGIILRTESALNVIRSKIDEQISARERIIRALNAPPLEGAVPYYVVRTKGAKRRTFVVAALRFRGKDIGFKLKGLFGKFDSLFEDSSFTGIVSRSLSGVNEAGPNLLYRVDKEAFIEEFALLQEEIDVDYKYLDALIYLFTKSKGD